MQYIVLILVTVFLGYFVDSWVSARALVCVNEAGKYALDGVGWRGLGTILGVGFFAGGILGLLASPKIGEAISRWIEDGQGQIRERLAKERRQLEIEKTDLDKKIREVAENTRQIFKNEIETAQKKVNEAEYAEYIAAKKISSMEGRLKGAQQRAKRLKKAALRRGDAPKPILGAGQSR